MPTRTRTQNNHQRYMRLALHLAAKAMGHTSPNPVVGAVVVQGGRIIGRGYHHRAGLPHAEVEALRQAGGRASGATLYVTLEPCNHTGRTPPCCEALLAAGISKVVIATHDPNPITDGRGIARLRRAGVTVVTGVLAEEARQLNAPFFKATRFGLPFVIAKVGQSLDGKIATRTGQSRWITSTASRRLAHQWRSRVDAILIGINTVLQDDPRLTVRHASRRMGRPIKVIVDSRLRTPPTARCLTSGRSVPTLIATTSRAVGPRAVLEERGAEVIVFSACGGRVPLRALCQVLAHRGVHSVLIEGGGEVIGSALAERLVDRMIFIVAPLVIGGRRTPTSVGGEGIIRLSEAIRLEEMTARRTGPDLWIEGRVVYAQRRRTVKAAGSRRVIASTAHRSR